MAVVNTIDTIEDLVRIMDERPEWVEAMRARLLTREVLELPQKIASLTEQLDRYVASTNQRLDNIEARLGGHDARFDAVDARFDAVDAKFDAVDARFDAVDTAFQKMRDDMAPLKAAHARNAGLEDAFTIADDMGLRRTRTLSRDDLWEMTESAQTTDIPTNILRSFRRADLVIEAKDKNGETCFIAVEISFTANGRDTDRAVRNAELLTRLTGKPSYAAVAGLNQDNRIQASFESGEVFWHQLDRDQLEVE